MSAVIKIHIVQFFFVECSLSITSENNPLLDTCMWTFFFVLMWITHLEVCPITSDTPCIRKCYQGEIHHLTSCAGQIAHLTSCISVYISVDFLKSACMYQRKVLKVSLSSFATNVHSELAFILELPQFISGLYHLNMNFQWLLLIPK